jgi:glycosyltransferase involved in cell wall biosynthesis
MNICLVNNLFPPILSGSSLFTLDLATQLHLSGHKVIVITSKTHDHTADFETHEIGFAIYRLKRFVLGKSRLWMKFPDFYYTLFPENLRRIKKIILENDIDLIHQCNNIFDMVFFSAYIARKFHIPLVCSLTTQIQHINPFINKVLEIFDKVVIKYLFANYVDVFIAGDKETSRYIKERYNITKNVKMIHYGINGLDNFSDINRDYSKTSNNLVSLGHVSEVKDRRELFAAWPHVKSVIPGAKIIIIGDLFSDNIDREIKKHQISKDVIFTGRVLHDQIPGLISEADIGTMFFSNVPYSKGVGSANIELMASGLPVIIDAYEDNFGSDLPFKNGIHFIKLESRNPEWLANKIIELFHDPGIRERIGIAGKEFVLTNFTWKNIIPRIEQVYSDLIGKNDKKK